MQKEPNEDVFGEAEINNESIAVHPAPQQTKVKWNSLRVRLKWSEEIVLSMAFGKDQKRARW